MNAARSRGVEGNKRLPATERKAQILAASEKVLQREGLARFSLEDVAKEAGVAATLPRHYFKSRDGLLVATVNGMIAETLAPLLDPDTSLNLEDRYRAYIRHIDEIRWAHFLWLRAESVHPDVERAVDKWRKLLVALSFGRRWDDLSIAERAHGAGWVGYFATSVAEWISQDCHDQELMLNLLLKTANQFGVVGA